MITIVDYGMGNLTSLANAFRALGERVAFAKDARRIDAARKLVFPGVGNFGQAMANLKRRNMDAAIQKAIRQGVPFLGICLGLQLLFEASEEAPRTKGLGILKGNVLKFQGIKTPHMGWNQLELKERNRILGKIKNKGFVYFMHSFYVRPADTNIVAATTNYGVDFCSALAQDNVFGTQFHPEKSGEVGFQIIKNFSKLPC